MKKNNQMKPRKGLPIWLNVILIVLFPFVFLIFGASLGFCIDGLLTQDNDRLFFSGLLTIFVGIIKVILLMLLMRNSDEENVKPPIWYVNGLLMSFTTSLIITALAVITINEDNSVLNSVVGIFMFPFIGIISTPNIIKYVKKDTKNWKHNIIYEKGNLHKIKNSKDFYKMETPVSYEKKLLFAVIKNQFLNVVVVIAIMLFVIFSYLHYTSHDHYYTNNFISNIIELRARRSAGWAFFFTILFSAFGIPIVAFYISNAIKKIKVVLKHEYVAYHVIVSSVSNSRITIYTNKVHYSYNYCTCVGIREKDAKSIPATLIFVPDDVFLFPDKIEDNKEIK
jgi:hypothetical protein